MEMEYKDPSKRGRWIVVAGVVLALAAGGAAFYLINQAQQQAGQGELVKVNVVVAARPVPVRQPIVADDLTVREVPADDTNTDAIAVRDPKDVIGQVLPVTLFQGQMITKSMLNTTGGAGGPQAFSILDPGQTVAPDSEAWRAVAITVPDDRAVGGMITAGMTVDVLLSAQVNVPQDLLTAGKYYTDKSTKIMYQNMLVLAKPGTGGYVVKATLAQAEEITHLIATGNAQFSMLMRPPTDVRYADASKLGETTNLIIQRYGLPIPQNYPPGNGPIATAAPTPTPSSPALPTASPGASSAP